MLHYFLDQLKEIIFAEGNFTCEDSCNVTACILAAGSRSFKYIAPHAIISSNKGATL